MAQSAPRASPQHRAE